MDRKGSKYYLQIYTNIRKHVINGKHECMCKNCHNYAINSHLLQRHGILSRVFEDGHIYEPKQNDILNDSFGKVPFGLRKTGINNALSVSLFCNQHDTKLFKEIESRSTDLSAYKSHLLLTYRTTCAECRRKDIEIEICDRVWKSNVLQEKYGSKLLFYQDFKDGFIIGRQELAQHIRNLEDEIENPQYNFTFYEHDFPISGIYASSTFSLTDYNILDHNIPLTLFVLHIIPIQTGTKIILGYNNKGIQPWQEEYIKKLNSVNDKNIEEYLTSLLVRINGWGISPNIYEQLNKETLDYFFLKFQEDIYNISSEDYHFNLFNGALLREYSKLSNI